LGNTFVDPVVSQAKFEKEVAQWSAHADDHRRRGILILEARFPIIIAAFAFPSLPQPPILFGVEVDFTNYDMWPPSVRFINPLTGERWRDGAETPFPVIMNGQAVPLFLRFEEDPTNGTISVQRPVISQAQKGPAFLCMRGVREYHEHPAHSGDAWLQYRDTGIGNLFYILDRLHEFGIAHIAGMHVGLSYVSGGLPQLRRNPQQTEGADVRA